jgi:hypothetical protein
MSYSLSPWLKPRFFITGTNRPLAGGLMYTYKAGTTDNATTYSDDAGTTNTNPIVLDSDGQCDLFLDDAVSYRIILKNSAGVTQFDKDRIASLGSTQVQSFNSIAALRLRSGTTIANAAKTLGYYSAGDGGGNSFYWDSTSVATDNGGTVIKPTAVSGAGRWLAVDTSHITPEMFGAKGDGVADDTNALNKLLEYCVENGLQANLTRPSYKVSGAALASTSRTGSRTLNINSSVPVTITMDSGASGLLYFIYLNTTAENSVFFTGSALTFNGSSKCASFMRCDHNGADNTGVVDIQSNVTIKNLKNTDAASTIDNSGMTFLGPYRRVVIREPEIDTVERTNVANGACSGITVSQFTGTVDIYSPKVSRVLTTSAIDADGIKLFGKPVSGVLANKRQGVATIHFGVFTDNQGRQVKSQCSETTIIKPISIRKNVVSIPNGIDFDFQCGNGLLLEPEFIYKKNAGTSPLGASFRPLAFQQLIEDEEMSAHCIDGKMITEVAMVGFCAVTHSAGAKESVTKVKGLRVIPSGGLATTAFTTSIIETRADTIEAKSARTTIEVSDCNGPLGCYGISYTDYGGTALTSKLNIVVKDNFNTLLGTAFPPFYKASGTVCRAVETFLFRNNTGFKSLYGDLDFSVNKLPVGCCVVVDLASCTITGGPGWAASGYATFQCVDQYFGATGRSVWAIKGSATAAATMYWTQDGGGTWGQVK